MVRCRTTANPRVQGCVVITLRVGQSNNRITERRGGCLERDCVLLGCFMSVCDSHGGVGSTNSILAQGHVGNSSTI